ncbi:MAG: AmmeMemoRadiSam system protein B [Deltaproteobacteria bacterium]|jgi:AmmeMemoRadiSam system protein B|nr:AmmeMemoRadiSam system protein B [Deltaproteobacteria bacterium]
MPEPAKTPTLRKAQLAGRWYPASAAETLAAIGEWEGYQGSGCASAIAGPPRDKALCVVPHAGWFFSGKLAARTLEAAGSLLGPGGPDVVAVLGGHLMAGSKTVSYPEDLWETPLDPVRLAPDLAPELASAADGALSLQIWRGPTGDNTVEVELPLVKHYFPKARVLALRASPDASAVALASALLKVLAGEKTLVVASTDLTHYGEAYGFEPAGPGAAGERFRERNDASFIEAALAMDPEEMLALGNERFAACSAGAAAAAACMASEMKCKSRLIDYYSSTDVMPGNQSVGYAGIVYAP